MPAEPGAIVHIPRDDENKVIATLRCSTADLASKAGYYLELLGRIAEMTFIPKEEVKDWNAVVLDVAKLRREWEEMHEGLNGIAQEVFEQTDKVPDSAEEIEAQVQKVIQRLTDERDELENARDSAAILKFERAEARLRVGITTDVAVRDSDALVLLSHQLRTRGFCGRQKRGAVDAALAAVDALVNQREALTQRLAAAECLLAEAESGAVQVNADIARGLEIEKELGAVKKTLAGTTDERDEARADLEKEKSAAAHFEMGGLIFQGATYVPKGLLKQTERERDDVRQKTINEIQAVLNDVGAPPSFSIPPKDANEISISRRIRALDRELDQTRAYRQDTVEAMDIWMERAKKAEEQAADLRARLFPSATIDKTYVVTCPKCNSTLVTRWIDTGPVGGVDVAGCPCGYQILSESEGNPQKLADFIAALSGS